MKEFLKIIVKKKDLRNFKINGQPIEYNNIYNV